MSAYNSKTGSFKLSALLQAVNLRPRMDPQVPDTALGNFVWPFTVGVEKEHGLELHDLVKKMKAETEFKEKVCSGVVMEALEEKGELQQKNKEIVVYRCTSWCNFPLLTVDFGWGKPVWTSSVNKLVSNTIALMDTRDRGVEALVTLDEQVKDIFEKQKELLEYALLNPSIKI